MKTYGVEPEFRERCIVKLKEPLADGNFADISASLLFISLSGSCIRVGVLQPGRFSLKRSASVDNGQHINIMDESKNLAGFGVVILVLSILFSSGCMKRDVISETEIQQKNQWWEDDSQNHLVEIIQTLI